MDRMPGEGPQPTVEEYLTRLGPEAQRVYGSSSSPNRRPEIQSIDEAQRLRDEAARKRLEGRQHAKEQWAELRAAFWRNIDDFLAKPPLSWDRIHVSTGAQPFDIARVAGDEPIFGTRRNGKPKRRATRRPYWEIDSWFLGSTVRDSYDVGRADTTHYVHEPWFLAKNGDLFASVVYSTWSEVKETDWKGALIPLIASISHGSDFSRRLKNPGVRPSPPLAVMQSSSRNLVAYL